MACTCCLDAGGIGRCFSRLAKFYRLRYEHGGFEPSQRQLLQGLQQAGVPGASVLEIGSGVGYLHQTLLEQGATRAVGVELSAAMLAEARARAARRALADRVTYHEGDFVTLAAQLAPADLVLLDKVICCYPDARGLVQASAPLAQRAYGYTIPRDRRLTRAGVRIGNFFLRLFGSPFRTFVHDPQQIAAWVRGSGFREAYHQQTTLWLTHVFVRA
jgi:magnesium-protoporphyrin O-methyltransferase